MPVFLTPTWRFAAIILLPALLCQGCMRHVPYDPLQVEQFRRRPENVTLSFTTDRGAQVAFYVPPLKDPQLPPPRLAILYPGIASLALDWMGFIRMEDDDRTGYLLIDYPGRGFSEGSMRPEENYLNTLGALGRLASHLKVEELSSEKVLLGHSFGTGAALDYAARAEVTRVVLVAPFNTLKKALVHQMGFIGRLVPSQIDNAALIRTLLEGPRRPALTIFHGERDVSLPVEMGRELAGIDTRGIVYHEIPGGGHTDILTSHRGLIFQSLLGL